LTVPILTTAFPALAARSVNSGRAAQESVAQHIENKIIPSLNILLIISNLPKEL
jgi:hypothetical protein